LIDIDDLLAKPRKLTDSNDEPDSPTTIRVTLMPAGATLEKFVSNRPPEYDILALDEFDPIKGDAAQSFYGLLNVLYDWPPGTNFGIESDFSQGLTAWIWFERIGVDLYEIEKRWRSFRQAFVPEKVQDTESGILYHYLDEAVRSYVFGAPLAAVALCRALIEYMLKEHYRCDGKDLSALITDGERRFPQLQKLRLSRLRQAANDVLHEPAESKDLADSSLEFIRKVHRVIELVPRDKQSAE
jgi:hypothetical protein